MDPRLADLAAQYWQAQMRSSPLTATLLGDHRFDDELDDLSEAAEAAQHATLSALREQAHALQPDALSSDDRVTRGMLLHDLGVTLTALEARLAELCCDPYTGPHAVLLRSLPQTTFSEPWQAEAYVARCRQIGRFFEQAGDRLRAGLGKARTPTAANVERVLGQLDGYLATPVVEDPLLRPAPPEDLGEDAAARWRDDVAAALTEVVRPAVERYRAMLDEQVLPQARPPERAGLSWIPDGEALYADLVAVHTSLALTPEEIHDSGRAELEQQLAGELAKAGEAALGVGELGELFARLRDEPTLGFASGEEIRIAADTAVSRAEAALGDWFGRLPRIRCEVREIPAFMAADSPMAYYLPPADDGSRPGIYWVNTHAPTEKRRFEAEVVAFHEALPGHHLDRGLASELTDLPDFQRHASVTAFVEGWGLYSERLADEMGLYSGELDRLGMLTADAWRTARLVVDTGLHALGWSREQAIAYMAANTPMTHDNIAVEIDRYTAMPGQALSYKIGQRHLFSLRAGARSRLGDRFDIRGFHDAVLTHGPLTLELVSAVVDEWVAAQGG